MVGTLDGPELPGDDALRAMVLMGTAVDPMDARGGLPEQLGSLDTETVMRGLRDLVEPGSPYRRERDERSMVLGSGSGRLVLGPLGLAPELLVTQSN